MSNLFKPITVGKITLDQRIAMAPLTRVRSLNHVPGDIVAEYYGQRASHPGTLLISEATFISPEAGGLGNVPGLYNKEQVEGWRKVVDAVHSKGSFLFNQLWALGRSANAKLLKEEGLPYVSASAVPNEEGAPVPKALTVDEIKQYVQWYVTAAKNAIAAGADGVELHSANGYLPDQFLHDNTNQRTDEYGGSIENKARFTLEAVDALIEAVGAERVGIRLSPWGTFGNVHFDESPIPTYTYIVSELEKRAKAGKRLAYIHLVEERVNGNVDLEGGQLSKNDFILKLWSGILLRAGALAPIAREVADIDDRTIPTLGRYFISNPDLVQKIKDNAEFTPYNRPTFYWDGKAPIEHGYTDYPFGEVADKK